MEPLALNAYIPSKVSANDSKEVSLKENVYDFSVDYDSFDKSDFLNINKYLVVKNSISKCLGLSSKCLLGY